MQKKLSTFASLTALTFLFGYIEAVIPISIGIPGVKLGLANVVILIALYHFGIKQAFQVSLLRIFLVGFTYGGLYTMLYSLIGGLLSLLVMFLAKKSKAFGIIGVSVLGAVFHNVGQLVVATIVTNTLLVFSYLPILLVSGTATGIVIGFLSNACLKRLNPFINNNN